MKIIATAFLIAIASACAWGQCASAPALMRHVYHPARLVKQKGCVTVTGTVQKKLKEKDGDWHIRLKLDPGQAADLINDKNRSAQGGMLVFEPICVNPASQADAKAACRRGLPARGRRAWKQKITVPNVGDHVRVAGIHVLDTQHGWLEIHPVTRIEVIK